jgi:Flp pilus assembly protein TadD
MALQMETSLPTAAHTLDPFTDHNQLGINYDKAGDLRQAVDSFALACAFDGTSEPFNNLGVAYMRGKSYMKAAIALLTALKIDRSNMTTLQNLRELEKRVSTHFTFFSGYICNFLDSLYPCLPY